MQQRADHRAGHPVAAVHDDPHRLDRARVDELQRCLLELLVELRRARPSRRPGRSPRPVVDLGPHVADPGVARQRDRAALDQLGARCSAGGCATRCTSARRRDRASRPGNRASRCRPRRRRARWRPRSTCPCSTPRTSSGAVRRMSRPSAEAQLGGRLVLELGDHPGERPPDLLGEPGVDVRAVQPADVVGLEDARDWRRSSRRILPRWRVCEYAPLVKPDRGDPLRRAWRAAAGALLGAPQAADRGRRPADRLARDQHVPGARVPAIPAADRIPGRAGARVRRGVALAGGCRGRLPRYRASTRRPASALHQAAPALAPRSASAWPTPTGWPTSTWRAARLPPRARTAATMAVVQPRLPFGVARLNGDGSVLGFTEKPRSELWVNAGFFCFERDGAGRSRARQHARARAARAAVGGGRSARVSPPGLLGVHGHPQGLAHAERFVGGRARPVGAAQPN